jgi:recombination protein RecT
MPTPEQIKKDALAVKSSNPNAELMAYLKAAVKDFAESMPEALSPKKLAQVAINCISKTPKLAQCTKESLVGALMTMAELGLEPVAGQAYLIPFWNGKKKVMECQFVIGYKGVATLFYRNAASLGIQAHEVNEADEFSIDYGANPPIVHKPALTGAKTPVIGYYALAHLQGGITVAKYMTSEEILAHAKKHSRSWDAEKQTFSGPWGTDRDAMSRKTVMEQLSKFLPLSVSLQRALSADESARSYKPGFKSAIDLPESEWEVVAEKEEGKQLPPSVDVEAVKKEIKEILDGMKLSVEDLKEKKAEWGYTIKGEENIISFESFTPDELVDVLNIARKEVEPK